nr:MAG TPA: hypothetical protein [Caudoviricetes sp.]
MYTQSRSVLALSCIGLSSLQGWSPVAPSWRIGLRWGKSAHSGGLFYV